MSGYFVATDDSALCPMSIRGALPGYSPQLDRHRAWVAVQDEVYADTENFPRDAEGELPPEVEKLYQIRIAKLADERLGIYLNPENFCDDSMQLHSESVGIRYGSRGHFAIGSYFAAAYLVCPICLFMLPGQIKSPEPRR